MTAARLFKENNFKFGKYTTMQVKHDTPFRGESRRRIGNPICNTAIRTGELKMAVL